MGNVGSSPVDFLFLPDISWFFEEKRMAKTIRKPCLSKIQQFSRNLLVGILYCSGGAFADSLWSHWHPSGCGFGLACSLDSPINRSGRSFNDWSDIFLMQVCEFPFKFLHFQRAGTALSKLFQKPFCDMAHVFPNDRSSCRNSVSPCRDLAAGVIVEAYIFSPFRISRAATTPQALA